MSLNLEEIDILFLHQTGRRGGASTMLANVIRLLNRRFRCLVVCPAGDAHDQFEGAGAKVMNPDFRIHQFTHISGYSRPAYQPGFFRDLLGLAASRRRLKLLLSRLSPRIMHFNAVTLVPYLPVAKHLNARSIVMVQETPVHGMAGVRTAWMKRMLSHSDSTLFISHFDRKAWSICPHKPAHVVPNWVDTLEFDYRRSGNPTRQRLGIPQGATVCLFLGGISELKGTLVAVQAIERASAEREIFLIIAGYSDQLLASGPKSQYTALVGQMLARLGSRVLCVGCVDDVISLYAAADIVLFPATQAHQSRPMIEAGAMKKPVIISSFPQLDEFCIDRVNCLRVPPSDKEALSGAILCLAGDSRLSARLVENNYSAVKEKHSTEAASRALLAAYEELL